MPRLEPGTAPTTLVVARPTDDRLVEPDERPAATDAEPPVLAVDDAAKLGGVEDLPGQRGVRGDRLDAVDGVRERERLALEVCEERDAELHPLAPVEIRESPPGVRRRRHGVSLLAPAAVVCSVASRLPVGVKRDAVARARIVDRSRVVACARIVGRSRVAVAPSAVERGTVGLLVVGHARMSALQRLNLTPDPLAARRRREQPPSLCVTEGDPALMALSGTRRQVAAGAAVAAVAAGGLLTSPDAVFARATWLVGDPVRLVAAAVVFAAVRPLVAWPTTLLAVFLGYGLGLAGVPIALVLVALTSVPPFLLARRLGGDGEVAAAGAAFVERTGGVRSVVASRLVPAPSDVVSVAAGVAGVRLPAFLVGTAIGEIPWVLAGTLVGISAETLTAGAVANAADPRLIAAAGTAAALLLAPTAYEWYLERRATTGGVGTDSDP